MSERSHELSQGNNLKAQEWNTVTAEHINL